MRSFGAKEFSEDYVQDVYIRLAERSERKKAFQNGKLNKSYIYFILRNTYINNIRKQRINSEGNYKKLSKLDLIDVYLNSNNRSHLKSLNENIFLDHSLEKHIKYEIIIEKIHKEILSWKWYDQFLFTVYFQTGKSIRTLEKEIGISYFSIFHTLKNCKERIKIAIGEDYEDFINEDFEHIRI